MDRNIYTKLVEKKPYLFWWIKNKPNISDDLIVEAILNFGDFSDFKKLVSALGINKVSRIFYRQISKPRSNYQPRTANFFKLYFTKYVS